MSEAQKEHESKVVFRRSPHDRENPYAQISRSLIRDESISPECRWMLIYLLSMRDDFNISLKQLCSHLKGHMGRERIFEIVREACAAGYMRREERRVGNLKQGYIYFISETANEEFKEEFKKCFRQSGFRGTEKATVLRKNSSKKERMKESILTDAKEKSGQAPPPPLDCPFRDKFEGRVQMTQEQYDRLLKKYNLPNLIEEYAEKLYRWSYNNPKEFKKKQRHDMVIEDWIDKDLKLASQKQESKKSWDEKDLNDAQLDNWMENKRFVERLKKEVPQRCSGLEFYYKAHVLRDKLKDNFSVSGLIDHNDFKRVVLKHLSIREVPDDEV